MSEESSRDVTIGMAKQDELPTILALLAKCGLPNEGLGGLSTILVARDVDRIVACSALELYQGCALLRSVAVDPSYRGRGFGQRLTRAALEMARCHQVATVYLLTNTGRDFFSRFGFKPVARPKVPRNVQCSVEFTTLCPDTALVMALSLHEAPQT